MPEPDPRFVAAARRAIVEDMRRRQGRKRIYLISFPRSGSTLLRGYLSILQGRPQHSVYDGDVVDLSSSPPLTDLLDDVDVIKSHQMVSGDDPVIYLVRDGRNATLSFLYMAFLFGGHRFSRLDEVYEAIRDLDAAEGSWSHHVAAAMSQADRRRTIIVRYEDLIANPLRTLIRVIGFVQSEPARDVVEACLDRHRMSDRYADNHTSGYRYEPEPGSIYDILKRHRGGAYWRQILDARSKRHFHEQGATRWLLQFGYETDAYWWQS